MNPSRERFDNLRVMLSRVQTLLKILEAEMAKNVEKNMCSVGGQFCSSNYDGARSLRATCFLCGDYVCKKCSSMRKYLYYGVVRLCNGCQIEKDENDGNKDVVMRRLRKMAGY